MPIRNLNYNFLKYEFKICVCTMASDSFSPCLHLHSYFQGLLGLHHRHHSPMVHCNQWQYGGACNNKGTNSLSVAIRICD